jgi:hypothetical protein
MNWLVLIKLEMQYFIKVRIRISLETDRQVLAYPHKNVKFYLL